MHMPPLAIFLSALSLEKPEPTPPLPESGPAHLLPDGRSLGAHVASAWSALSEQDLEAGCKRRVWEALLRRRAAAQPWAYCGHLSKYGGSSTENCVLYLVTKLHLSAAQGFATKDDGFAKHRRLSHRYGCWRGERGIRSHPWAGTNLTALTFNNSNNRVTFSLEYFHLS